MRRFKADPRFRVTNLEELKREIPPRRTLVPEDLSGIKAALAAKFGIPATVRLPIDPSFAASVDGGAAEFIEMPDFEEFAAKIV